MAEQELGQRFKSKPALYHNAICPHTFAIVFGKHNMYMVILLRTHTQPQILILGAKVTKDIAILGIWGIDLHGTANSKNYLKLETYIDRAVIRAPKWHDTLISLYSNKTKQPKAMNPISL